jgi:hypothetical protein
MHAVNLRGRDDFQHKARKVSPTLTEFLAPAWDVD